MKITNEGIVSVIETERIHFMVLTSLGQLIPNSIKFRVEYLDNSLLEPNIQGLSIDTWLHKMLENKIINSVADPLSEEFNEFLKRTNIHGDTAFLFVDNTSLFYVSNTLFQILQKLLPEIQFKSIEYELE